MSKFPRQIACESIDEGLSYLDDLGKSFYDMYVLEVIPYPERDGWYRITVWGWQNKNTREYSC